MRAVAAVFLLLGVANMAVAEVKDGEEFVSAAELLRKTWDRMRVGRGAEQSDVDAARAALGQLSGAASLPGKGVVFYLKLRLTILGGEKDGPERPSVPPVTAAMIPEILLALVELDPANLGRAHRHSLAELVPVSVWGRQWDAGLSAFTGYIKPPRTIVPVVDPEKMLELATSMEEAGLYDLAWRAYAEAVYGAFAPAWVKGRADGTWLSPQATELWHRAAECAYKAGETDVAWEYLMKSAVFGSEELYDESVATAKRWAEAKANPAPEPVNADVKRKALLRAVQLYVEMNAHPRAWALVDANRELFENPDALRAEIQQKWLAVVKDVSRAATKVVLYGHEVYPKGDPLKVTIPWALSDEAVTAVRKRLAEQEKKPPEAKE